MTKIGVVKWKSEERWEACRLTRERKSDKGERI